MSLTDAQLQLFARDLNAYAAACLQIRTKGGYNPKTNSYEPAGQVDLRFNKEQRLLNQMLKDQYQRVHRVRAIVLKARQVGISTYTAARFFRKLNLFPSQRAVVIADELDRAEELFGMYDRYASFLPEELKPMVRYASKKKELYFDNPDSKGRSRKPGLQSSITVETAGDTAVGKGATIQMAHMSEFATWPNALEVYISLRQAVPDYESEIIVESTAYGAGNLFHQMWKEAEEGRGVTEGKNGYLAVFFPWWTHENYTLRLIRSEKTQLAQNLSPAEQAYLDEGIFWRDEWHKLTLEQIAWRRWAIAEKTLGDERQFRQEYPATPDEAFLLSGAAFFDEEALALAEKKSKLTPPKRRGFLIRPSLGGIAFQRNELGYLKVWDMPRNKDALNNIEPGNYVIGADTATGKRVQSNVASADDPEGNRERPDFSVADVIDTTTKMQVAQLRGRMPPEVFADQLHLLGHFYSTELPNGLRRPALLAVERNHSSGETVIDLLTKGVPGKFGPYPNMYGARYIGRRSGTQKRTPYIGWVTSPESRQRMLDNLAAMLRDYDPDNPLTWFIRNEGTISEMQTFVRLGMDGKPEAQEGTHDDQVISLAIACMMLTTQTFQLPKNFEKTRKEPVLVGNSPTGMFQV